MLRWIMMTGIGLITLTQANGQLKKFYSLKDAATYDTVRLSLEASTGSCYFKNTTYSSPLNIYGNPDLDRINPTYHTEIKNNNCHVGLKLEEFESSSFDEGLSPLSPSPIDWPAVMVSFCCPPPYVRSP